VFRATVKANESTDVDSEVKHLRQACETAGVAPTAIDLLIYETRQLLTQLVERGKQFSSQGSQIQVTRDVVGDGYAVKLVFGAGIRPSLWERLAKIVRGA
jgi:hypothetical protein